MAAEDSELFTKRIRVENKILFVDVRQNSTGMYLKLSEKRGMKRNSIIIPASGISDLHETLAEALSVASPNETTPKKVAASPAPAKSAPQAAKSTLPATNSVKVVNLAFSTTEEGLANHFRAVGNVVKATIILRKSKDTEISSGRGIVEFDDAAGVAKAQTLHESELDGRKIAVQGGKREGKAPIAAAAASAAAASAPKAAKVPGGPAPDKVASPTKVFVTNLSWETTDNDLETYFSRIGAVKSAIVKKSKSGRSFGQGIVEFVADSDTAEAIDRLNNTELDGRSITIRPFYESAESS